MKFKLEDKVTIRCKGHLRENETGSIVAHQHPDLYQVKLKETPSLPAMATWCWERELELVESSSYWVHHSAQSHAGHEIVDNEVEGKAFKFCRQCRIEVW